MQALILEQQDGKTLASVQPVEKSRLPEGEVTVDIDWSSLNYKDALAITGKGKIIRNFPMVPGIDFAGGQFGPEQRGLQLGRDRGRCGACHFAVLSHARLGGAAGLETAG